MKKSGMESKKIERRVKLKEQKGEERDTKEKGGEEKERGEEENRERVEPKSSKIKIWRFLWASTVNDSLVSHESKYTVRP